MAYREAKRFLAGHDRGQGVAGAGVVNNFPPAPSLGTSPVGATGTETSYNVSPNLPPLANTELAAVGWEGGFHNVSDLAEWLHIVHAQSGGSPGAVGVGSGSDTEYSIGLSQINVAASPDLAPGVLTPTTNALDAHTLFLQRGWQPWAGPDLASPPSSADLSAATQIAQLSSTDKAKLANLANRTAIEAIQYSLPPYPGTSTYPQGLQAATWPKSSIPSGSPGQQALYITLLGNAPVKGGEPPGTKLPATPPVSLPGATTNKNLSGFAGLLQQLDKALNPAPPATSSITNALSLGVAGSLQSATYDLKVAGTRLAVALPGVIGVLMAAASGLLGITAGGTASKALSVIPAGKAASKLVT